MKTQTIKACFTITFTEDQYLGAKAYVDDMLRHPARVFWHRKRTKAEEELIVEQIAHRILSGFYKDDSINASRYILDMVSKEERKDE